MFDQLPTDPAELRNWTWADFAPYYDDLKKRPLSPATLTEWLKDWTRVAERVDELYNRLYVAVTVNTADEESRALYMRYLDETYTQSMEAEQALKEKLLHSGLKPEGFEIPLRNMHAEAELFRPENLPLLAEEQKLTKEYDRIVGAQTVQWEGEEKTLTALTPYLHDPNRNLREKVWRLSAERRLADRQALNDLWVQLLELRQRIAANAGAPDYRAYRWKQMLRFDYTPEDSKRFCAAIEEAVVPAARQLREERRRQMNLPALRPWDVDVDPLGRPGLRPFDSVEAFEQGISAIFHHIDPVLGERFDIMRREHLLDLDNRKNKAPGGYCTSFAVARKPFIFMNAVGTQDDVSTLLHEGGHAFHVFESAALPYMQQLNVPMEFAEVASMSMEYLGLPFLTREHGAFYDPEDARRARWEQFEKAILFWPYMAVVDSFQHWVYEHPHLATDPAECDKTWSDLWRRFMVGVDESGFEDVVATGWHRKLHIFQVPFYYVEYGLAQLGAAQVWLNSLKDRTGAVQAYRKALSLGGTVTLPQLYETAGARLAFDAQTLRRVVDAMLSAMQA